MTIKLWVDDARPTPDGWVGVHSVRDAIRVMRTEEVEFASLDHDLGDFSVHGGDGVALTDWMARHGCWPAGGLAVHSANPVGAQTMLATVDRYGPYVRAGVRVRVAPTT